MAFGARARHVVGSPDYARAAALRQLTGARTDFNACRVGVLVAARTSD
jgi:nicotinic acid phosphoribosyltransferase